MKNKILLGSLLFVSCLQAEAPGAMPSVADVFGGMSEDEITKQVQLGQQFLEDLEKFGTPEEKAQFEQLLVETLNSMTPDDFDDIQKIAKMVEPNLEFPAVEPQAPTGPIPTTAKEEKPVMQVEGSEVENFKTLISSITQRIDDILQKMNSSKECAQELDARWSSRATFGNMKRQIYQLRNTRLAQKLAKADITGDEKSLVDTLKDFLKELTQQNDAFTIEDDFGLPSSKETEQKQLKKTKTILTMFDGYIDSLMPKLEKFLVKWDPEALQLAKESEEKSTKALKDATDATVRRPSADARPAAQQPYNNQIPGRAGAIAGSGYQDFGGAGYPGYDQYGAPTGYESGFQPETGAGSATGAGAGAKAQPTTPKTTEIAEKKMKSGDAYADVVDDIEGHLEQFNKKHVDMFSSFLRNDLEKGYDDLSKIIENYPPTAKQQPGQSENVSLDRNESEAWLTNNFNTYATNAYAELNKYTEAIVNQLKTNSPISQEFANIENIVNNASQATRDMNPDATNKLATQAQLETLKQRLNAYRNDVTTAETKLNKRFEQVKTTLGALPTPGANGTLFKQRNDLLTDVERKDDHRKAHILFMSEYEGKHTDIMKHLKSDLESKIDSSIQAIENLQRTARKKSTRKSSSSAAVSTAING